LVKRLHRFPAFVIAAQRTFLVAFFLAATLFLGAVFLWVAFLALRIERSPIYRVLVLKNVFF